MILDGFLNLNKPPDFTSHDCVAKLRKILQTKKIGHGGTLDPSATGVLPIAVGKATRLLQFLPTEKAYQGIVKFGITTTTDDLEGEIINQKSAHSLTLEKIQPLLRDFIGKIEQIPPAYSAIKQDGKKLYQLARQGETINITPRQVEIFKLEIINWRSGEYPELELNVNCGAGTYIRAIARDLGEKLGYGATLASLNRTLSCGMTLENSLTFEQITTQIKNNNFNLIPLDYPLQNVPKIELEFEEAKRWCLGQKIKINLVENNSYYRIYHQNDDRFLGISELRIETNELYLKPKIVINSDYGY